MEMIEVVRKLIGPTRPVGETNEDNRRFNNLRLKCYIANELLCDIKTVSEYAGRGEYSMSRAGKYAGSVLFEIGELYGE